MNNTAQILENTLVATHNSASLRPSKRKSFA